MLYNVLRVLIYHVYYHCVSFSENDRYQLCTHPYLYVETYLRLIQKFDGTVKLLILHFHLSSKTFHVGIYDETTCSLSIHFNIKLVTHGPFLSQFRSPAYRVATQKVTDRNG